MAEVLVHRHVPIRAISEIVCHGAAQQRQVQSWADDAAVTVRVNANAAWYF